MATTRRTLMGTALFTAVGIAAASRLADPRAPEPAPDDLLIDAAIAAKQAFVTQLASRNDAAAALVAQQQQEHISALRALRSATSAPAAPSPSPASGATASDLEGFATQRTEQALRAHDGELARVLLLVAASEGVHARVLA